MPIPFPSDYDDNICYVVAINKALIPLVGGLLKITEKRGFWLSDSDYEQGYNAIVDLESCLMATCLTDLVESNDRVYRLLNTAIFGQLYVVEGIDPLLVSPPIEPAVDLTVLDQDSLMGRLDRLTQLTDNTFNGTETPLYDYVPSVKTQLQAIIDAMGTDDTDIEDIIAKLELLLVAVG